MASGAGSGRRARTGAGVRPEQKGCSPRHPLAVGLCDWGGPRVCEASRGRTGAREIRSGGGSPRHYSHPSGVPAQLTPGLQRTIISFSRRCRAGATSVLRASWRLHVRFVPSCSIVRVSGNARRWGTGQRVVLPILCTPLDLIWKLLNCMATFW